MVRFITAATILSSLLIGSIADDLFFDFCAPGCWCIPDEPDAVCPDIGTRVNVYSPEAALEALFYATLTPVEDSLYTLVPPGCQPYPSVALTFGLPTCTGVAPLGSEGIEDDEGGEKQCRIEYEGEICSTATYCLVEEPLASEASRYLKGGKTKATKDTKDTKAPKTKAPKKTKEPKTKATKAPKVSLPTVPPTVPPTVNSGGLTHTGSCGVCSSAQDLAVYLSPELLWESTACIYSTVALVSDPANFPTLLQTATDCHKALGFSDSCAYLWGSKAVAITLETVSAATSLAPGAPAYTGPPSCLECATTCLQDPTINPDCVLPFRGDTCTITACAACQDEAVEPTFQQFSGRTRRKSGITGTVFKRPCSSTVDIAQPTATCPA